MENLLLVKGLWKLIKNGVEEPTEGTILTEAQLEQLEQSINEDHKVTHYVCRAIDCSIFEQVLDKSTFHIV